MLKPPVRRLGSPPPAVVVVEKPAGQPTAPLRPGELGTLANRMTLSTEAPSWQFGTGALMRNLAQRGLL